MKVLDRCCTFCYNKDQDEGNLGHFFLLRIISILSFPTGKRRSILCRLRRLLPLL
nr:MAG TPA: hypothetical protein [Caudoviricetes sp.]